MYSPKEIAELCQGQLIQEGKVSHQVFTNLCTDSRSISSAEKAIFIPLITDVRNAHKYIPQAYTKGIRCFLFQDSIELNDFPEAAFIQVDNTFKALQCMVANHRSKFSIPVIGITGSNGKTIVKEFLSQLLQNEDILKSPKSYNSQLGVALSVWPLESRHVLGLFEAGISQKGEMEALEKMIQPSLGIFTMIGKAHSAGFTNQEEKIREKIKLFAQCKKIIYNRDEELVHEAIETAYGNKLVHMYTWGYHEEARLRIKEVQLQGQDAIIKALFAEELVQIQIPFSDKVYIDNAIIAWLSLLALGKKQEEIQGAFLFLQAVSMRLELKEGINDCTIINDSYSSDTASLSIALDFLAQQHQHKKHSLILSDILQHGQPEKVYRRVAEIVQEHSLERLICIGSELKEHEAALKQLAKEVAFYPSTNDFMSNFEFFSFADEAILIKGARAFAFERIVNRLEDKIHQTVLAINLSAFTNNLKAYKRKLATGTKLMAMVKAFSYGSGTFEIANVLEHQGVDYLAVAYVDEGIALRRNGISLPIMVLNPSIGGLAAMQHYQLEPEIYSLELFRSFSQRLELSIEKLRVHIKLDTGMHRLGIEEKDLDELLSLLAQEKNMVVQSVFSHLVASDSELLDEFTKRQGEIFAKMAESIEATLKYKVLKHLANTEGVVRHSDLQFDMVRIGLGLYGISSNAQMQNELEQISTLKASVSQLKHLHVSDTVGYSRAGKLQRETISATINIGYADGYVRAFSQGKGKVLIRGKLAPVLGNVCMDMIMVDVTDIADVQVGDEVIIFGEQLPVTQLAKWIDAIPYEIITNISQRVKRVYYQD